MVMLERIDPTRLPKIMISWKPEGRKKRGRPRRTCRDGIYTAMNGEMGYIQRCTDGIYTAMNGEMGYIQP
jgi:hypothetical protein